MEFVLDDGISDTEAVRLIETPISEKKHEKSEVIQSETGQQTLKLDDENDPDSGGLVDPFVLKLNQRDGDGDVQKIHPVIVDRNGLLAMDSASIFVCKWNAPLKYQFFRNLLPDVQITMCHYCFKVVIPP